MEHLHDRMDKLFAKGKTWRHRTLRTLFDPYSSEWNDTTMNQKIEILKKIAANESLQVVFNEYNSFYKKEKPHVAQDSGLGLLSLLEGALKENGKKKG